MYTDGNFLGSIFGVSTLVFIYLFCAYSLYRIGEKLKYENTWHAFVPLLNMYMFVTLVEMSPLWVLLLFVPFVNVVVSVIVFHKLCVKLGKNPILAFACVFSPINIILLGYLAFSETKISEKADIQM